MHFPHCAINDLEGLLWVHVSLLSLCAILIVAALHSQFKEAAPYGRHADPQKAKAWGFPIPQRIGHIISDAIPGIPMFLAVYLLYAGLLPPGGSFSEVRAINVVLLCGWLLHYLYRGILHPLIMPYSSRTVAVGITLSGILPNVLFGYLIAAQLACTAYPPDWASQPRFIIGVALYGLGTVINRWADLKLRAGRLAMRRAAQEQQAHGQQQRSGAGTGVGGAADAKTEQLLPPRREGTAWSVGSGGGGGGGGDGGGGGAAPDVRAHYFVPRGGLFEYVSCPNYLGELVEWAGYALALWSWPGLAWALFGAATFVPRSLTNHSWYKAHFGSEYPPGRKALIPFLL